LYFKEELYPKSSRSTKGGGICSSLPSLKPPLVLYVKEIALNLEMFASKQEFSFKIKGFSKLILFANFSI
jgi:hypothetical protein